MKGILKHHDCADDVSWFGRMPADLYIAVVVIVAFGRLPADWYIWFAVIVAFGRMPADWYIWFAVIQRCVGRAAGGVGRRGRGGGDIGGLRDCWCQWYVTR